MKHSSHVHPRDAVTFLFVPGDRPDRFVKAASAGADAVIVDLEDAVAPANADAALANTVSALSGRPNDDEGSIAALVRVHPSGSPLFEAQITALLSLTTVTGHGLSGLMVAKAEDAVALHDLRRRLPTGLALIALIESARGVAAAERIAAVPGLTRLAFGALDFALDVGAEPDASVLDHARDRLVLAGRLGDGSAPVESPSTEIVDAAKVRAAAKRARSNGFGGMLAIHPAQLEPIAAGFAPTADQVAWATEVLAAEGGAAQVRGQLVDRPVTERAKSILLRQAAADARQAGR